LPLSSRFGKIVERFEFKSLPDRQTDENTPSTFVDEIPPWRVIPGTSHATTFRRRSRGRSKRRAAVGRPMQKRKRRPRSKAEPEARPSLVLKTTIQKPNQLNISVAPVNMTSSPTTRCEIIARPRATPQRRPFLNLTCQRYRCFRGLRNRERAMAGQRLYSLSSSPHRVPGKQNARAAYVGRQIRRQSPCPWRWRALSVS
jgi:hypothetical protein